MQLVPLAVAVVAFIVVVVAVVVAACNAVEIVVIVVAVYAAICRVALEGDQRRYLLEPDSPTFEPIQTVSTFIPDVSLDLSSEAE